MVPVDRAFPVRMRRVAIVALKPCVRQVLVALAAAGTVEVSGPLGAGEGAALEALRRLESGRHGVARARPVLAVAPPDIVSLERRGACELLAGEVELARRQTCAVTHGRFALFVGWAPQRSLPELERRLHELGASVVALPVPRGQQPPTLLAPAPAARPFRPLVTTYGPVPYQDLDPTAFVALTYCLMFGMMFGDAGDGLLVVLAALLLRGTHHARLQALQPLWPLIALLGACAAGFGVLYGELFGPTKLLPTVWLEPLDAPIRLLTVAIVAGGALLAAGHLIGIVNRWREGGPLLALTDSTAVPGISLLLGMALVALGVNVHAGVVETIGFGLALLALLALLIGLRAEAGPGATGAFEVLVGLLDALLRLFSNVFSFARLAAFGLMHAAIGKVVLDAAGALTGTPAGDLGAVLVFAVGWSLAFALEALVVAVQALRLEYYELFSRLFAGEGRAFKPWSVPLLSIEEAR